MRVNPLTTNLRARLLNYKNCVELDLQPNELKDVVVIGNGTPDDVAIAALCKSLNGKRTIAMIKSKGHTGLGAIESVINLIYGRAKIERCIMIIDQDNNELDDMKVGLEKKFSEFGVSFDKENESRRTLIYECKKGQKTAKFCLCINGLDGEFNTHAIEDHLLKLAEQIGVNITNINNNPKETWNGLTKENRERVLRQIWRLDDVIAIDVFPQHVEAFGICNT